MKKKKECVHVRYRHVKLFVCQETWIINQTQTKKIKIFFKNKRDIRQLNPPARQD